SDEVSPYFGHGKKDATRLQEYVDSTIQGMESGLFAYLAHPDLFLRGYGEFDEAAEKVCHSICKRAKELDFILEYNLAGLRYSRTANKIGYPHPKFWEIAAKYKCKAIVGVDAHNNEHLEMDEDFEEAIIYLKALGLEVVNEIPMRNY
ncbi:MAG: histidinol phosphatase, partial [Erysipelotrichales bacterium]|nr:histidinol phosphatase [Erysipelotrichales bacterium]